MHQRQSSRTYLDRLLNRYDVLRSPYPGFYAKALEEATLHNGCYLNFWRYRELRFFVIYRKDRKPEPEEFLPFLQTLFLDTDGYNGPILEVSRAPYSCEFVQGPDIYESRSIAEQMGDGLADYADKKDEVEQFDFDRTGTGKRLEQNETLQ